MRFHLVVNLERMVEDANMVDVLEHVTDMVKMADQAGFDIVWAAEHHALEMTIAPGPFQLLAHFAGCTDRIRLGTAVVVAAYWHPIKLAGEAALLDLISGGRLEFGIGKGAYQREFDRMSNGMAMNIGVPMMLEMVPALKGLWKGDYEHNGEYWQFPTSTSCPKPLQQPHPPIWVAARDPSTYASAIKEGYNIMSWAFTRGFEEVEKYKRQFEDALAENPDVDRPKFMTMRHTGIYETAADADVFTDAIVRQGRQFENLFKTLAPVVNGFPQEPPLDLLTNQAEFTPENLRSNLILGTPDQAVERLKRYEKVGVDSFCYNASYGLPMEFQKSSLRLFINEVMPAFQDVNKVEA